MKAANSAALRGAASLTAICLLTSCGGPKGVTPPPKLEAVAFVAQVNTDLVDLAKEGNAAGWTQQTYITPDTQYLNARVTDHFLEYFSRTAAAAAKYDKAKDKLDASTERSLLLIKLGVSAPAPSDPAKRAELANLSTELDAMYGEGKYCPPGTNKDGKKTDCRIFDDLARDHRHQPQLRGAHRSVDRLALDRQAHASQIPALRRARERRSEGARLRRRRSVVARALRHARRGFREGRRPALRTGEAAVPGPALLRAQSSPAALRQGQGAGWQADPGALVRQHVGAAVESRL